MQANRDHAAEVRASLCRLLAAGDDLGPEESLLLLKMADPPDAAQLLALAKTAASMPLEPSQGRHLYKILKVLIKRLPNHEATPVLLALCGGPASLRPEFKQRVKSWANESPGPLAAWLEQSVADGSLRTLSESDQESLAGMIAPLRLMAEPAANLERIRKATPSMHYSLLREGLRHARTPAERRDIATTALTLPEPKAVEEALAAMVKDGGIENTAAWLSALPGMPPAARTNALATLATAVPEHSDIADNASRILSHLPANQQGDFVAAVTGAWADKDHEAAAKWINASTGALWQDRAREGFALRIAQSGNAVDALIWAGSIGDAAQRSKLGQSILDAWQQRDATAVQTFLQSPECPPWLAAPQQ